MSDHAHKLQQLLDELGPITDEVVLIEQLTPQAWLLALDDGDSAMAVKLDESTGVVTLSRELGRPLESMRQRVYEALLTYNGLAGLHGGIRMALREPGGAVLQEFDFHLHGMQLDTLRQIVQDFNRKASAWEEIIESAEPPEAEPGLNTPDWDALRV